MNNQGLQIQPEITNNFNKPVKITALLAKFKDGIWFLGIPSWVFGVTDRGVAAFADGSVSAIEVLHLLTASFFFLSWLYLKPVQTFIDDEISWLPTSDSNTHLNSALDRENNYLQKTQARMLELQDYHAIGQEYYLPFPYLCQIYHLLNLKHLESIHHFSLNHLKVIKVCDRQPTATGGQIKFQTVLDSPFNPLRIWRQPIVEVELTLHSPYTVELRVPVYGNKSIIVMFNVLPLSHAEHKLFINIYTDLEWPRPLLQILFHFASCLTLFEDWSYFRQLAERNLHRLVRSNKVSDRETMWLFKRFVDLYGSRLEALQLPEASTQAQALASN